MDESTRVAIWVVAGSHVVFAIAEVLLWETLTPLLKIYDPATARTTAAAGRNIGIYNGFVAACLSWLLLTPGLDAGLARSLGTVLLAGVVIVGLFGSLTIKWTIFFFQPLPALIALGLLLRSQLP